MDGKSQPVIEIGMGLTDVIRLLGNTYQSTAMGQNVICQFEHATGNYLVTFQDNKVVQVLMPSAPAPALVTTPPPSEPSTVVGIPPSPKLQGAEPIDASSKKVVFIQKQQKNASTYEVYQAPDAESAKAFLLTKTVIEPLYYIVVDTPDGSWGMDKIGLYLERLRPWQSDLSKMQCSGIAYHPENTTNAILAAKNINDNYVTRVVCRKCKHEWLDGVRYQNATIVRCPQCASYNKVYTSNFTVVFVGEPESKQKYNSIAMLFFNNSNEASNSFARLSDTCGRLAGLTQELRGTIFELRRAPTSIRIIAIRSESDAKRNIAAELLGALGIFGDSLPQASQQGNPNANQYNTFDNLLNQSTLIQGIKVDELPSAKPGPCPACNGTGQIQYQNRFGAGPVRHSCQFCMGKGSLGPVVQDSNQLAPAPSVQPVGRTTMQPIAPPVTPSYQKPPASAPAVPISTSVPNQSWQNAETQVKPQKTRRAGGCLHGGVNEVAKIVIVNSLFLIFFAFTYSFYSSDLTTRYLEEVLVGGNLLFYGGKFLLRKIGWFHKRAAATNILTGLLTFTILSMVFNTFVEAMPKPPIPTLSPAEQLQIAALAACNNNTPIAGAATYENTPGFHPIVLIDEAESGGGSYASRLPAGWQPDSINNVQLIGCITDNVKLFKSCPYSSMEGFGTVELYKRTSVVTVIAASTGKTVSSISLDGPDPYPCARTETFTSDNTLHKYYGDYVSLASIISAVKNTVSP